jgi:HKD family nuclease
MKTLIHTQFPDCRKADTLDQTIASLSSSHEWEQMSVAVAYSSLAGVSRLHEVVLDAHPDASFRWLLGLDDYITQPGAIDFCCSVKNAEVRIYSSKRPSTRFHPKVLLFDAPKKGEVSSMIIGSANLTFAALNRNCEAVAVIEAKVKEERALMRAKFDSLWSLGTPPTTKLLSDYKSRFDKFYKTRAFLLAAESQTPANKGPILHSDTALINPGTADVCWIEVGKNTAMGRELEVKGEQARFFGLEPSGGTAAFRNFLVSNGQMVPLRLKYQGNAMWRLQLRATVPEVDAGLRPVLNGKLGRSPYVAVFKRTPKKDLFSLSFPRRDSKEFRGIWKKSESAGTIGSTASREYGWH